MKKFDVSIVGGGPVGGYVAEKIAKQGYKTSIFEEHKKVGMPLKCAGLVSPRIFDLLNIDKSSVVQNEIYGAKIHSPSGEVLNIGGDRLHAFVVDRSLIDEAIVKSSEDSGAEIFLETKVEYGKRKADIVQLDLMQKKIKKQIQCSLLIGADGSRSPVRDLFGFPQPNELLQSIGAEVTNTNLYPKYVEIFLGRDIAPGFFAWIIPLNSEGSKARIGLCVESRAKNRLKRCFSNLMKSKQLRNVNITKHIGGAIPLGPLKKTVESNVMLVGDAAAQVKPTSGGGVYPGLVCADCCASVAVESFECGDFSSRFLSKYHRLWYKELGKELSLGMRFRNFFRNLDDNKIDEIIKTLNNKKSVEIIGKYGDIDYPSKLAFPVLKTCPSLLKFLPSVIKERKWSLFR